MSAALAVQMRHLRLVVARAGHGLRRNRGFDSRQLVGAQFQFGSGQRIGQLCAAACADQRHDIVAT